MSCYRIQYKDGRKTMTAINSREEYMALRNQRSQQVLVEKARKGDKASKAWLMQFNYSCHPNKSGTLRGATECSGSVGMDIDHLTEDTYNEAVQRIMFHAEELGLLMLERSARGLGLHVVFKRDFNLTQEENLRRASDLIGCEFDAGAKDITRVFFTTTGSAFDLLFLSDELFDNSLRKEKGEEKKESAEESNEKGEERNESAPINYPNDYEGVPYAEIVEQLATLLGGVPEHGSRNQFIFAMACNLRYICNHDYLWLERVLPNYGESQERVRSTIKSACNRAQNASIPRILQRAISIARDAHEQEEAPAVEATDGSGQGKLPPKMPEKLPKLIELLISKTPDIYKPAVAHAVFPALGAHLYNVRFPYLDEVEHEATLMNVLMAGTGAGKSCITGPIKCIMADIQRRDAENREKEREWKTEMQTKGANKDKKKRPEGLTIQWVRADMTNAAFVQRTKEAEGRFLYTLVNEIDQFDALKSGSGSKSHFQIMCLAFDPGNTYGTERVGLNSVSEDVCIRFNFNASTTVQKGKRYFSRVLTDGPISRINFCTIPERPIGSEIPIYGTYDAAFERKLAPYIARLNAASGTIVCEKALQLASKLKDENALFAQLSDSRVYENLSFRANVIAYLKAMVLYVANGEKWEQTFEDFIRWSEQYDLWCKMHFFGEAIEEEENSGTVVRQHGARNLMADLPQSFTIEDLQELRRKVGKNANGARDQLYQWKHRKLIRERTIEGVTYYEKV